MARLAISKDYFPAYAALPRKAQRKADELLKKFELDSTAAAIHLEPIKHAVDGNLRSARIGDDYRVILRAPDTGDVFLVLWADHHDEAYRWAETKQTAVHPATGSLQIFDVHEATDAVGDTGRLTEETLVSAGILGSAGDQASLQADLLAAFTDDELFVAGVPHALIPSVRALVSESDLDKLLPYLPPEAGEVLTALAAGIPLDEALEEVLGRVTPPAAAPRPQPIDVSDVSAALARETTQRQFRLLADGLDLDAALKHPLDVWRVFLHPKQRKLAEAHTKGPTRVLGGAGTGKTVVALHRVAFLLRELFPKPDDRVLFTTFNVNLAHDLRAQLAKILEPDELARVEVINIDAWAAAYLRGRGVSVRPAYGQEQRKHLEAAHEVYGKDEVSFDFYQMEWREVIQAQGITTEDEYVRAVRKNRGVPLGRADRRSLWPVFAAYRDNLEHAGLLEPLDILRRARAGLLEADAPPRYRSVVVDETQDFSADALRLLRAIAGPERPNDLFLVGDAHQRIYGRPASLSQCGIAVRGRRTSTLRLNYRTTGAICRWSLGILKDVVVDDLDEGSADRRGYISLREGPAPRIHPCETSIDEEDAVVAWAQSYVDAGLAPEAICVVGRTQGPLRDRFAPALQRAGLSSVVLEQEEPRLPGIRVATMHRVKGLEFAVVLLVSVNAQEMPFPTPELRSDDAVMSQQARLRERSLLYVAASRARDFLHIFYSGEPSSFLAALPVAAHPTPTALPSNRPPTRRPSASSASPAAPASDDLASLLARPLGELQLGTRMQNWVDKKQLVTVGDLARLAPADLLAERNLGRTSVKQAREALEAHTGCKWEELLERGRAASLPDGPRPTDAEVATNAWDRLRMSLTDEQRSVPLSQMPLSARVRTVVEREKLATLGDLAAHSRAQLIAMPNLARGSVGDLPAIVEAHLASMASVAKVLELGLLACFIAHVEPLEPMQRLIITRRAGLVGEPQSLQELGDMFGLTRERVRQIQAKLCEQLGRQAWAVEARRRVEEATKEGAIPLDELGKDPWWTDAVQKPSVVGFVTEDVLRMNAYVIERGDAAWLSRDKTSEIDAAFSALLGAAQALEYPAPFARIEALTEEHAGTFGRRIQADFLEDVRGRLRLGPGDEPGSVRALAFGDTRGSELLALLRASPEPMAIEEVGRLMGVRVGSLPEEVLSFRRGYIGLQKHFPDFDAWSAKLIPAAWRIIEELGPARQWSCEELLDELREEHDIPPWLTAFGLASLIRVDGSIRYLGRLRVSLPGAQPDDTRVHVHQALEQLLVDAGGPLPKDELLARLDVQMSGYSMSSMVFHRPMFVRIDEDRIGLLARDVPGGAAAIAEATAHFESILGRRERGLSERHAHEEVVGLSEVHARWSPQLTLSVLRSDGRFRLNQSGTVGLATWESTRVPTKLELLRSALEEAGGRVSVEAVMARVEAHYGARSTRNSFVSLAAHIGASVDGDWVVAGASAGPVA
jgi:superfamily I DNA/RNA helicase/mRNA-degrading endonuclease RelE of RelBE toxin-antitoxin system